MSTIGGNLQSTQKADFKSQALTTVPEEAACVDGSLDLRDNAIARFDGVLRARHLYLGRNVLREAAFGQRYGHLEVLDLSDNKVHSVQLEGLTSLRLLNLAGNSLQSAEAVEGLGTCSRLQALDLSRNLIQGCPFQDLRRLPDLQLLSLLGNEVHIPSSYLACLPKLAIWNGRALKGKEKEAAAFVGCLPSEANFMIVRGTMPTFDGSQNPSAIEGGPSSSSQPSSLAQQPPSSGSALQRRTSAPVLDSADDMTSGATSHTSSSETGEARNNEQSQSQHLGLVERQDSANYQPRPPALAERQDSAQILQALAEDEAALAASAASGAMAEAPGLTRQDSARDLGDLELRSPSPRGRRAASPLPFTPRSAPSQDSMMDASGASATQMQRQRSARLELCISPRQDSASDRMGHRGAGFLDRATADSNVDRSPRQDLQNAGPSSPSPLNSPLQRHSRQSSAAERLGSTGMEVENPQSGSLEAARQLLRSVSTEPQDLPSSSLGHGVEEQQGCVRQDSALDTLSEARRAVLSDLPKGGYIPVSTSDPLQQARKLYQESTVASPPPLSRVSAPSASHPGADCQNCQNSERPLLGARPGSGGPLSPFEGPLTPLSPAWTASQLPLGFSQQLPSIESGIPWTLSSSSHSQLTGEDGSLLAEARRVVLGAEALPTAQAGSSASGPHPGSSRQVDSSNNRADRTSSGLISTQGGFTTRDTPFPDSPLAAEKGSPQQTSASQQAAVAFADVPPTTTRA